MDLILQAIKDTGHHPLGASGYDRWGTCAGSLRLTLPIKGSGNNDAAALGTLAHELAEKCLNDNIAPYDVEGEYSDKMLVDVTGYVEYVRGISDGIKMYVEQKLDLRTWIPEGFGTADVVIISPTLCHIIDYKNGYIPALPEDGQTKFYALGAMKVADKMGVTNYRLHIYQPNNGGAKTLDITRAELVVFGEEAKIKANLCLEPDAPLVPEEKACRFCRAKATCPALYEHSLALVGEDFDNVDRLSDVQLCTVLDNKSLIESWLKSVEALVLSRLDEGTAFGGYKLVEGRSSRKLTDKAEIKLTEILGDDAFDKKLKGIGALEKLLGKKHFADLAITVKPRGKTVLAKEDDPRPAVIATICDFD